MIPEIIKGFIILSFIFIPLERVFCLHSKKIFRREWTTDILYFFIGHFIGRAGSLVIVFLSFSLLGKLIHPELQSRVAAQPIYLQFCEAIVIADFGYYIAHRLLHTVPWLWKFHAVHHSIEQMDWLATVRVHPFDQIFTRTWQMIPLYLLGFTEKTLGIYAMYSAIIAFLIHSNTRLKFGFLKWIVATPEFHHWHHSKFPKIGNKNFAAQFPLLDWLLGSLYMPKKRMPQKYGIPEQIPTGYFKQIMYPFLGEAQNAN